MRAEEFTANVVSWNGVPYHHQGRTRAGCDCVGLILGSLAEIDALLPSVRIRQNYGARPQPELIRQLEKHCEPRARGLGPELGGLVSIRWQRNEDPGHLAIFIPPQVSNDSGVWIAHSHIQSGRVVLNQYDGFWLRHTVGFWRIPGIEY